MKQVNCIIVDDEPLAIELLEDYVDRVAHLHLIGTFDNPIEAISFVNENEVDLLFLDIEMPEINGINFVDVLTRKPHIIFTTAYSTYGVESYEKNALDYLLKPINFERFLIAVNKLIQPTSSEIKSDVNTLFIKSNGAFVQLKYDEIGFIESLKDYVIFNTEKDRFIVYHSLKKLEEIMPASFQRVHYSYMANLNKVEKIKDQHLHIFSAKIPISKKHREHIYELVGKKMI
ncbi:MAG: response regulator [Cyclobacteriaceae bacterium]